MTSFSCCTGLYLFCIAGQHEPEPLASGAKVIDSLLEGTRHFTQTRCSLRPRTHVSKILTTENGRSKAGQARQQSARE
jgi:hypothetical protein